MKKTFYLTSAIPYVNAAPHIGHAQEFVYADVIRRYHQLLGENVLYLCGADENALKIFQAAEKDKKEPQEFTDLHNKEFQEVAKKLNVHFDIWQRGSDTNHHFSSSQKLWELCAQNGDIYRKSYTGLYCVGCEMFYTKEELNEQGECFEHPGKKLDQVSEDNYFFNLSKYQKFLEDLIETDKLRIVPQMRKNEVLAFIRRGLEDFSVSRSKERARGWGIPVPQDPDQIMYVWFDALNIYQSGIGFGWNQENYDKWSPQDVMVIGKGIIRFHAVYWPAILASAHLQLPKELFVHGYMTVNGQKMSKTLGNVVDPQTVLDQYGTDAVRYYLLREIPSTQDGDYSNSRMKELYNSDLANELGNLLSRLTTLGAKDNLTVDIQDVTKWNLDEEQAMLQFQFNNFLEIIWKEIKDINKQVNDVAPWNKTPDDRKEFLIHALRALFAIGYKLQPFLPETASKIMKSTQGSITKAPVLFPRIS